MSQNLFNLCPLSPLPFALCLRSILKTQTSHQTSVDECRQVTDKCRRMQTSVDESLDECRRVQTSVDESLDDECRRMQTSHRRMQTSVDKSLDECRRVQTNLDKSLDECRQMQTSLVVAIIEQEATSVCKFSILQFCLLLLLLITVYSLLTSAKPICLFLHLTYVNSNLIDGQKASQRKWETPLRGGWGMDAQLPPSPLPSAKN